MRNKEQELVDLCFELVFTAVECHDYFKDKTKVQIAEWVSGRLAGCGFPTVPVGMSWGMLLDEFGRIKYEN